MVTVQWERKAKANECCPNPSWWSYKAQRWAAVGMTLHRLLRMKTSWKPDENCTATVVVFTMCTWSTAWFKLPSFRTELKCPNCRKPLKYWWHVQQNTSKMPDTCQYFVCSCQYLLCFWHVSCVSVSVNSTGHMQHPVTFPTFRNGLDLCKKYTRFLHFYLSSSCNYIKIWLLNRKYNSC